MAKLKVVLIAGPDTAVSETTKVLYTQEELSIIGDGVSPITLEMIENSLSGKIDSGTRIEIIMHGGFDESGNYFLLSDYTNTYGFTSAKIFSLLSKLTSNAPLEVHTRACHSQAALKDISNLPKGSILITYSSEKELSSSTIDDAASADIAAKIQRTEISPKELGKLNLQRMLDNIVFRMPPDVNLSISGDEEPVSFNPHALSKQVMSIAFNQFYTKVCQKISALNFYGELESVVVMPHKFQLLDHELDEAVNWHFKSWFFKKCSFGSQDFLQFMQAHPLITQEMVVEEVGSRSIIAAAANNLKDSEIFQYLWSIAKTQGVKISEFFDQNSRHFIFEYLIRSQTLNYLLDELREFNSCKLGSLSMDRYSLILCSVIYNRDGAIYDKFFNIVNEEELNAGLLITKHFRLKGKEFTLLSAIAEAGDLATFNKIQKLADSVGVDLTDQLLYATGDTRQTPLHQALYYPDRPTELTRAIYDSALQKLPDINVLLNMQDIFGKTPFDYGLVSILALHADESNSTSLIGDNLESL